jgi:hypothetical protein
MAEQGRVECFGYYWTIMRIFPIGNYLLQLLDSMFVQYIIGRIFGILETAVTKTVD